MLNLRTSAAGAFITLGLAQFVPTPAFAQTPAGTLCKPWATGGTTQGVSAFDPWNQADALIPQIALVVGNDYKDDNGALNVPHLNNTVRDAESVSRMLVDKGYAVVCLTNMRKEDILSATDRFSAAWEVYVGQSKFPHGVIYFAGHGGEDGSGEGFIVPSGYESGPVAGQVDKLPLGSLLALLPDDPLPASVPVVIIDACRTKEFLAQPGTLNPLLQTPFFARATHTASTDYQFDLILTTSSNKPAGDGQDVPDGHGTFVSALQKEIGLSPWANVTHPFLTDLVNDLKVDMPDQLPSGPYNSGVLENLWKPRKDDSEHYYLWDFGVLSGRSNVDNDICDHVAGGITALNLIQASQPTQSWATAAKARYGELNRARCQAGQIAMASGAAPSALEDVVVTGATIFTPLAGHASQRPRPAELAANTHFKIAGFAAAASKPVADAVADKAVGYPVTTRAPTINFKPANGGEIKKIDAGDFSADLYGLDCGPSHDCAHGTVRVKSRITGETGIVASGALLPQSVKTFVAPVNAEVGMVPTDKLSLFSAFLDQQKSAGVGGVEIALVGGANLPANADLLRAADFLTFAKNVAVKRLNLPADRVAVVKGVQQDSVHSKPCLAMKFDELCFVVSVTSASKSVP